MADTPNPERWAIPSVDDVLANPAQAEDRLHASLTVRALKWLAYLEQDEQDPALTPTGQRVITLDLQVDMFKVISEWLKTSHRVRPDKDDEDKTPGVEAMQAAIVSALREMDRAPAAPEKGETEKPPPKPKGGSKYRADEDNELATLLHRARDRALRGDEDE